MWEAILPEQHEKLATREQDLLNRFSPKKQNWKQGPTCIFVRVWCPEHAVVVVILPLAAIFRLLAKVSGLKPVPPRVASHMLVLVISTLSNLKWNFRQFYALNCFLLLLDSMLVRSLEHDSVTCQTSDGPKTLPDITFHREYTFQFL